jgi:YesN/AraC family two-component response regulator
MDLKTILIVDDEQTTRQGLQKTLEKWSGGKYIILSAADGHGAFELFNKNKIHLLISDISMPEMDGLVLLKKIKENGYKPVVIIVSGYPDFNYAQEAIRLGVTNYLLKPLSKQKLIEAVEHALETEASLERTNYLEKVADDKLITVDAGTDHSNSAIKEAIDYINKNIQKQITLKEVANTVHLNASYFSVLFKDHTRMTFSEFITRKRLQIAKTLLLTSNLQVEEISFQVGYQTAKYFIKIFKDYEGITPSKFRKMSELEDATT